MWGNGLVPLWNLVPWKREVISDQVIVSWQSDIVKEFSAKPGRVQLLAQVALDKQVLPPLV